MKADGLYRAALSNQIKQHNLCDFNTFFLAFTRPLLLAGVAYPKLYHTILEACDICYTSNIYPYSQTVAIFICNLQYRHLCYLPLVGIGKFEDQLTLLGPKSKTRFLFQIRSEAIGKIEKDDTGRHYGKKNNRTVGTLGELWGRPFVNQLTA